MRKLMFLSLVIFAFALAACSEQTQEEQVEQTETQEAAEVITYASWNKMCPVEGGEVDNTVQTVDYNGKAYGFCCSSCDDKFSDSPETYAKNLSEDGTEFLDSKS